jgi:hypothetical protein
LYTLRASCQALFVKNFYTKGLAFFEIRAIVSSSQQLGGTGMMLKQEFNSIVKRLELDSERDLYLAEIVWEKCEAVHGMRGTQTPALLKKPPVDLSNDKELSRSELQFLTGFLRDIQHIGYNSVYALKQDIRDEWEKCDSENKDSYKNFKELNKLRTLHRAVKKQMNKLSLIQNKLKKIR